jgi:dienelactone hydrolase
MLCATKKVILLASLLASAAAVLPAQTKDEEREIVTQTFLYKIGGEEFEGSISRPAKLDGRLPAVLVIHDWTGFGEFVQARAKNLAQRGYVAFAIDVYGKGRRAKNSAEAGELATPFYKDRALLRERCQAALAELLKRDDVDPKRIGAMGFCFGGSAALELARSGADLRGVVSFHGGLTTPNPADAKNVRARLLILHGALDPLVPPADVAAFMTEMNAFKIPYRLIAYPGAVHAFTNPDAGSDLSKPAAYNLEVAVASYREMQRFFELTLAP